MIYLKQNPVPSVPERQTNCFEYMFVLSKGKPNFFNPRVTRPLNIPSRTVNYKYMYPLEDEKRHYEKKYRSRKVRKYKLAGNIWKYKTSKDKYNKLKTLTYTIQTILMFLKS